MLQDAAMKCATLQQCLTKQSLMLLAYMAFTKPNERELIYEFLWALE